MATELGKAYVQIIPSAKGIGASIKQEVEGASGEAGTSGGRSLASKLKGVLAAAGIGVALKNTLMEGADLQQSLGGIETMFKGSADKMKAYAQQAYKTSGISANEYMKNVTSFSAGLIKSVGGDTSKAADIANMAMIDMSDNANKMGTSMEDIQNAYQGFAKQNYTMLDNLKLGYGGTKSEMERLLADAEKLTGVHYDINNLSDVYSAIHAIQEETGITGTTAQEAATTLSGSFASMKAAAQDFMGQLVVGNDIGPYMQNLLEQIGNFVFNNLLPAIGNIISNLFPAIQTALEIGIPAIYNWITTTIPKIAEWIRVQLPQLISTGFDAITNFVTGLWNNAPSVLDTIGNVLAGLLDSIVSSFPTLIEKGGDLIFAWLKGIGDNGPSIWQKIGEIIMKLLKVIWDNLPKILEAGVKLIGKLLAGIIQAAPGLMTQGWNLTIGLVKEFLRGDWIGTGVNIIKGLIKGILGAAGQLIDAIVGVAKKAFKSVLSFLGIHSPSRKFAWIGEMTSEGFAQGIVSSGSQVTDAMADITEEITRDANKTMTFDVAKNREALDMPVVATIYTDLEKVNAQNSKDIQRLTGIVETYLPTLGSMQVVMDSGTLVGAISPAMDTSLAKMDMTKERCRL